MMSAESLGDRCVQCHSESWQWPDSVSSHLMSAVSAALQTPAPVSTPVSTLPSCTLVSTPASTPLSPCSPPACLEGKENPCSLTKVTRLPATSQDECRQDPVASPALSKPLPALGDICKENVVNPCKTSEDVRCHTGDAHLPPGGERRKRRKALHPQKSLSLWDPNFHGVTLSFTTVVHGGTSELIITPIYSKNLGRIRRRRHQRFNSESEQEGHEGHEGHSSPVEASADSDQHGVHTAPPHHGAVKSCASCATRRTPLWRDAEDGTPLCNACGIRYRKYRLRCASCWHIPRKDNKLFPACSQCGGLLRFSQARKC